MLLGPAPILLALLALTRVAFADDVDRAAALVLEAREIAKGGDTARADEMLQRAQKLDPTSVKRECTVATSKPSW